MARPLGSDERSGVAGRRRRPRTWRARIASLAVLGTVAAITAGCTGGGSAGSAGGGGTTFVGTPRSQTLIMDNIDGRIATPGNFNPYFPGVQIGGDGVHALVWSPLWEIDTTKGAQFPELAAAPIQPLDAATPSSGSTCARAFTGATGWSSPQAMYCTPPICCSPIRR